MGTWVKCGFLTTAFHSLSADKYEFSDSLRGYLERLSLTVGERLCLKSLIRRRPKRWPRDLMNSTSQIYGQHQTEVVGRKSSGRTIEFSQEAK